MMSIAKCNPGGDVSFALLLGFGNSYTIRKRRGVQKFMGNKVPWKTGMLIYLPVTLRPLMSLHEEEVLSPSNQISFEPGFGAYQSLAQKINRRKPKGDGGKGTGKKHVTTICDNRHDNLRHGHDNLRHFMTISVSLFH